MIARARQWERLRTASGDGALDLLVIGGGITGAAILYEASRRGLRAALVERGDFASGTSSRSSKLVHGGLRYLREGKIALTRESVRERRDLLRDAPGLVESIEFMMPHYRGRKPSRTTLALGLALYDMLAGAWNHRYVGRDAALALESGLDATDLTGAHLYGDATTDDARLVLRLIEGGCDAGALAVNYANAAPLVEDGDVRGAHVTDAESGATAAIRARATINATGVFADGVREGVGAPRMRPLRGSHLVLDRARLPLAHCVAFEHPGDGRPVFAYPWLGGILVGTTDLDHRDDLVREPAIDRAEFEYLIDALRFQFPNAAIAARDVVATYAGVRPIVDAGDGAPSHASRDHVVWNESGMVTIAGGKLTTFRPMALDALRAVAPRLPKFDATLRPVFERTGAARSDRLDEAAARRLTGRFGAQNAAALAGACEPGELDTVGETPFLWAELRWSARNEAVVHLDDLLLRRTRIGLLEREGGAVHLERVAAICTQELGWDAARWDREATAYRARVRAHYGVPA